MDEARPDPALAEASDPNTTPERLRTLYSQHGSLRLRQALAQHPNTPADVLFRLFPALPNHVAEHPALPRLLSDTPRLFAQHSQATLFALAADPTLRESALSLLVPGAPLRLLQLVSLRPDLSEPFLITLAQHGVDVDWLLAAPQAGPALWCQAAQVRHSQLPSQNQIFLSREPHVPAPARQILAQHPDAQVQQSLRFREEPPTAQAAWPIRYAGTTAERLRGGPNEDRVLMWPADPVALFLVVDGMSGAAHTGAIAAEALCETVRAALSQAAGPLCAQDFFHRTFCQAFHAIAQAVFHSYDHAELFQRHQRPHWFDTNGAGATTAAVMIQGTRATIAHLGDCRVYLRRDGQLTCLTQDHSLLWLMEQTQQKVPPDLRSQLHRVVARMLGSDAVSASPTLTRIDLRPQDRLLLCSDGVHQLLSSDQLGSLLAADSPQAAVDRIVTAWQDAGQPDDLALVVVDLDGAPLGTDARHKQPGA